MGQGIIDILYKYALVTRKINNNDSIKNRKANNNNVVATKKLNYTYQSQRHI